MELLDEDGVRGKLRQACDAAGGQKAWALANGFGRSYVHDVLKGNRRPSKNLAARLGCELRYVAGRPGQAKGEG